jgi:hypothetical protein
MGYGLDQDDEYVDIHDGLLNVKRFPIRSYCKRRRLSYG